jgi:hypothetical protein
MHARHSIALKTGRYFFSIITLATVMVVPFTSPVRLTLSPDSFAKSA